MASLGISFCWHLSRQFFFADWISLCDGALSSLTTRFLCGSCTLHMLTLRVQTTNLLWLSASTTCIVFWCCRYSSNNVISKYSRHVCSYILAQLGQWNGISEYQKLLLFFVCILQWRQTVEFPVCRIVEHVEHPEYSVHT